MSKIKKIGIIILVFFFLIVGGILFYEYLIERSSNEKISTKDIECTQSLFTKKLDRENYRELNGIVGMHIDSNKIKIIEQESKIPKKYKDVRCSSYLSNFIPKIIENKIFFERNTLWGNAECDSLVPENLPRFFEQNFIKTECNFINPVKIDFIEKNIETKEEQILNKEVFNLPVSVCERMIDNYTKDLCYHIYQKSIIKKSKLNSHKSVFSSLNYIPFINKYLDKENKNKNKYILDFSSENQDSILSFKNYIDENFQGTLDGVPKTNWAYFDFYQDNEDYHFIISTSNDPINLGLLSKAITFYFDSNYDINLEIFTAIHKMYHFNTFPSENNYFVDDVSEYNVIDNNLKKSIPYNLSYTTQESMSQMLGSEKIWEEHKSFLVRFEGSGAAHFTFYLKPQDVEKVDKYFSKLK